MSAILVTLYSPDEEAFTFAILEPQVDDIERLNAYAVYATANKGRLWETASGSSFYFEIDLLATFLKTVGGMGPKEFAAIPKVKEKYSLYIETLRDDMKATGNELRMFRDRMSAWRGCKLQPITAPSDTVVMPINITINRSYTFPQG